MIAFVMIWGFFSGFMTAKTVDYNMCMKQGQTQEYCMSHYSYQVLESKK